MLLYYRSTEFKLNDLLSIMTHFRVWWCSVFILQSRTLQSIFHILGGSEQFSDFAYLSGHRGLLAVRTFIAIYAGCRLIFTSPVDCASLPGKHFIQPSLPTSELIARYFRSSNTHLLARPLWHHKQLFIAGRFRFCTIYLELSAWTHPPYRQIVNNLQTPTKIWSVPVCFLV